MLAAKVSLFLLFLSSSLVVSVSSQNVSGGNLTFVRLVDPTPFPATSSAGAAFLTSANVTAANGQSFPPASWIVLGHNYYTYSNGSRQYSNGQQFSSSSSATAAQPQSHRPCPACRCCCRVRRVDHQ